MFLVGKLVLLHSFKGNIVEKGGCSRLLSYSQNKRPRLIFVRDGDKKAARQCSWRSQPNPT